MDNEASLTEEMKDLRTLRHDSNENTTEIKEKKKRDGCLNKSTHWAKVRMVHKCEECGALRERLIEDHSYRCGDIIRVFNNGDVLTSWYESS